MLCLCCVLAFMKGIFAVFRVCLLPACSASRAAGGIDQAQDKADACVHIPLVPAERIAESHQRNELTGVPCLELRANKIESETIAHPERIPIRPAMRGVLHLVPVQRNVRLEQGRYCAAHPHSRRTRTEIPHLARESC